MELRQEISQKLFLRITPQLITAQTLLHCSDQDLEKAILQEMEENPALEWEERAQELLFFSAPSSDFRPAPEQDDLFPPLPETVAPERALKDDLLLQAHVHAKESLKGLVEQLIEKLDPTGYLLASLEELSEKWKAPLSQLEEALLSLQSFDPPGIGARTPQECLLLQLRQWEEGETCQVQKMLRECWDDFLHLRKEKIAEQLGISQEEVESLFHFVQAKLTLYPGNGVSSSESPPSLIPDLLIEEKDGVLHATVVETRVKPVRISPLYAELFEKLRQVRTEFSEQERRHILHYLERTKNFLKALEVRREMLLNVARALIRLEEAFLRTKDPKNMPPLTQSKLAQEARVSESTISRAVSHKNVQLPWGRVVPISFFLSPSQVFKEKLLRLLLQEDSSRPLTDQKIAQLFTYAGQKMARRTVAKYREELGIPATPVRKRMGENWKAGFKK